MMKFVLAFLLLAGAAIAQPSPCDPTIPDTTWMVWSSYDWEACAPFCSEDGSIRTYCLGPFPLWCLQLDGGGDSPLWAGPLHAFGCHNCPDLPECGQPDLLSTNWYEAAPGEFWICSDFALNSEPSGYTCISVNICLSCAQQDCFLPVELLSFSAVPRDQAIVLMWRTASETNMSHFEIARDGNAVANMPATNHATGSSYQWRDENLTNGHEYFYTLTSVDIDGAREEVGQTSATPQAVEVPSEFALLQNYPNPFNASTTIEFVLADASDISLTLHNLLGEHVATLSEGMTSSGTHRITLNASAFSSGIYFYRLSAGPFTSQKKLVLLK